MNLRMVLFCVLSGLVFLLPGAGAGNAGWWYLSGVLIAASLLPVVMYGPKTMAGQFSVISVAIIVVGLVCILSEGMLFYPEQRAQMAKSMGTGIVMYLAATAVMVILARMLKLGRESAVEVEPRAATTVAPMVLLSAIAYVGYYMVFGAITFQLFTKKYYPHAAEQFAALGNWFWVYQLGRGLLMVLAVLPIIYTLRLTRRKAALLVGILVWVVGGLAPLVVPNTTMVTAQRYEHIVEIFTQNFSLGVTAVCLLRRKTAAAVTAPMRSALV